MKKQTLTGSRSFRRAVLLVTLVGLLALVVQVGLAQPALPAAASTGTLNVSKSTTPAGGQNFWVTAASFQGAWGSRGSGPGQYRQPRDIEVDAAGNFYVSDHRGSRVQKLDASGNFLMEVGTRGKGNGQLLRPNAIAIAGSTLYVADTDNDRLVLFNTNGSFIANWGTSGSGDGQFHSPHGVAVDGSGNVYVADTWNHRIQVFTSAGAYVRQIGSQGSGQGQLLYPTHIDFDAAGNLYVADSNNHRVVVFDSLGNFVRHFGGFGTAPGRLRYPVGLDVGTDGYLYVSDTSNNRVQKYTTSGVYVGNWSKGAGGLDVSRPNGLLAVGDKVYVSDIDANKVQIFSQASFPLHDGQQGSAALPAGTYDLVEAPKTGWTLGNATCDGGNPTAIPGGVRVTLADGANVSCAFANAQ